jgi:hypothetical protein
MRRDILIAVTPLGAAHAVAARVAFDSGPTPDGGCPR